MIAAVIFIACLACVWIGMLIGGWCRDAKLTDAYAAGKVAGLRQARRERLEADAEFDAWYSEQERSA